MKRIKYRTKPHWLVLIIIVALVGVFLAGRLSVRSLKSGRLTDVRRSATARLAGTAGLTNRALVLAEYPGIIPALAEGAKFGNDKLSTLTAQNIFSSEPDVIEEIRGKTTVIEVAPETWLIRLPIVNVVLFETSEGLVLVDSGMAAAGPVIREIIEDLSDQPPLPKFWPPII